MKSRLYQIGIVSLAVVSVFLFASCPGPQPGVTVAGKVTGGGWIENGNGGKANFGFNASSCKDPENPTGRFNFHDKTAGVMMNGNITGAVQCDEPSGCADITYGTCPYKGYIVTLDYRSTNPKMLGEGTAGACVVDNGEGSGAPAADTLAFGADTGPYIGYNIQGTVKGNIQAHGCDEVE